jgi:hypothetical protein
MIHLVFSPKAITNQNCPETINMDVDRLENLRRSFAYITKSLSFIAKSRKQIDRKDIHMTITNYFANEMDDNISANTVCEKLQLLGVQNLNPLWFDLDDPVSNIFYARIRAYVNQLLLDGQKSALNARSLVDLIPRIQENALKLIKISEINHSIHGQRYREIISSCCSGQQ